LTQRHDRRTDPPEDGPGPLRFVADEQIRLEAEDLAFERGAAVEDVAPHTDGRGLTVTFDDGSRRVWRWAAEEDR